MCQHGKRRLAPFHRCIDASLLFGSDVYFKVEEHEISFLVQKNCDRSIS